MATLKFAVLPGDGIGPEVMNAALDVLKAACQKDGDELSYKICDVGGAAIDSQGKALPESTIEECRNSDAILFGSVGGPKWEHLPSNEQPERAALLPLRKIFKLFANIRPGLLYPQLTDASPLKSERIPDGIDIVCIRELTGGIYFGEKKTFEVDGEPAACDTMMYRKSEIERIADVAGKTAMARGKKICSIDKANVLETSVLWRKTVTEFFKKNYPEIELSYMYVDNAAMQLARNPNQFDVFFTENMFGDILSDEASEITGSIGMVPSSSLGEGTCGLYEPIHGSAPDIAGQDVVNPIACILSAAMMLRYSFDMSAEADEIEAAVSAVLDEGCRTADMMAPGCTRVGCTEMGNKILEHI